MKRKIYAILLLLSFLIVLSHKMISHHHDILADNISIIDDQHDILALRLDDKHSHPHAASDEKNEEKDSNQEHNHPFPFHHHISTTNDFDFTRVNFSGSNPQNQFIQASLVLSAIFGELSEPPNLIIKRYPKKTFLIHSSFKPRAITLRGPPSIV